MTARICEQMAPGASLTIITTARPSQAHDLFFAAFMVPRLERAVEAMRGGGRGIGGTTAASSRLPYQRIVGEQVRSDALQADAGRTATFHVSSGLVRDEALAVLITQ